ncbi:Capsule polysaccharide biosynthesis protein [Marinobacter litoralis]|uniref:Capsule polysaccharide biosynthesis protein n=1 Tax=Marinobacter litoralis TaxID=187981 RepID=A0A3M2RF70_9GAMM|nr:hypothetical protein [Marinobacter litoralis]RMJ03932.1 Capsule polysaccharide biosynthesis protein [Marinobacter litoralis]
MKTICFIANFEKTFFYLEIAKALKSEGYLISWITTSKELRKKIISDMPASDILYLSPDDLETFDNPSQNVDINVNEILAIDRILTDSARNKKLLQSQAIKIERYLRSCNVNLIIGELTWAHELLISRLASELFGVTYVNPHTIRIPDNRIAFFTDEEQSKAIALETGDLIDEVKAKKPKYLKYNDEKIKKTTSATYRVKKLFTSMIHNKNVDPEDQTKFSSWIKWFVARMKEGFYRDAYGLIEKKFDHLQLDRPYILYTLHKQPEASVDVIGSYFSDQEALIKRLWTALPDSWDLIVKEHSNAVGDRSPLFYARLKGHPNLFFAKVSTDSYSLIRGARAVFTISGTSAYEAALMGVPSFTFSNCFFNCHPLCQRVSISDLKYKGIKSLITESLSSKENPSLQLTAWLEKYSMEGQVGDPIRLPSCMEPSNIQNIARALKRMI